MTDSEIEQLVRLLAKLPGLGPRSARRAALYLLKRKESRLEPLARALAGAAENIRSCSTCGNFDTRDPCAICTDPRRDPTRICVIEEVSDLWAIERTATYKGRYHVLGGTLSALDGVGPEDLNLGSLFARVAAGATDGGEGTVREVILATNATVDGQTTAHYLMDLLAGADIAVTRLAHGVPVGGELEYLDDGTLSAAFKARRPF